MEPATDLDFRRYYELRWRILRAPWGQPPGSEKDALESVSSHVMACLPGQIPLGVGRVHLNDKMEAQIRFMAVEKLERGRGIGRKLLHRLEAIASRQGAQSIIVNARETVLGFYEKAGYEIIAPAHTHYGTIHHISMIRQF